MKVYTTVRAARELGVGRDTLYRWMRDGIVKKPTLVLVGDGAAFQPALWTENDLSKIRALIKKRSHKNLGRKRRKH